MANQKETLHHMVFGLTIGKLSDDGKQVVRNPNPVSLKSETFSKVTYAVIDNQQNIKQVDAIGVILGCDQLQRNLIVKSARGLISVRIENILTVKQYSSVTVSPGCNTDKVPSAVPADAVADDEVAETTPGGEESKDPVTDPDEEGKENPETPPSEGDQSENS